MIEKNKKNLKLLPLSALIFLGLMGIKIGPPQVTYQTPPPPPTASTPPVKPEPSWPPTLPVTISPTPTATSIPTPTVSPTPEPEEPTPSPEPELTPTPTVVSTPAPTEPPAGGGTGGPAPEVAGAADETATPQVLGLSATSSGTKEALIFWLGMLFLTFGIRSLAKEVVRS